MCRHKEHCSFFRSFSGKTSLVWRGMIKNYCGNGAECERRKAYDENRGATLSENFMPSGAYASNAFLALP